MHVPTNPSTQGQKKNQFINSENCFEYQTVNKAQEPGNTKHIEVHQYLSKTDRRKLSWP